jgi:general secretion pathway protein K
VKYSPSFLAQESGVALLTALLVVALASIAAAQIFSRQVLDVRRTENLLNAEQAWLHVLGAEDWARQILHRDSKDSQRDHLAEPWALKLPPTPVDGGQISGELEDLQGRFNLNHLLDDEGKPREADLAAFQRLLEILELPAQISDALLDWIDPDQLPQLQGAEDATYQHQGYRAANRRLLNVSELRSLVGMTPEAYQTLAEHVSALPERTPINLNTVKAPVLAAFLGTLSLRQVDNILEERPDEGYEGVANFLQHPDLAGLEIDPQAFGVTSRYFLLRARADIGIASTPLSSVLKRRGTGVTVLWRSMTND